MAGRHLGLGDQGDFFFREILDPHRPPVGKPTRQPGLWFRRGNLHLSRFNSQFVALQIKARMENIATPVYGLGEVDHPK